MAFCLLGATWLQTATPAGSEVTADPNVDPTDSAPCCPDPSVVYPHSIDGTGKQARFESISGAAFDLDDGNLYVAEPRTKVIRRVAQDGSVTTIAGNCDRDLTTGECVPSHVDGVGRAARFSDPTSIAYSPLDHDLYVSDGNFLRAISPRGVVSTVASHSPFDQGNRGIAIDLASGDIYLSDFDVVRKIDRSARITVVFNSSSPEAKLLDLRVPGDMTYAKDTGALYIAFYAMLGRLDRNGKVTNVAGCGHPTSSSGIVECNEGYMDGPASQAEFKIITGIAYNPADGNIYVADLRGIRRVAKDGNTQTLAGGCGKSISITSHGQKVDACYGGHDDGVGLAATFSEGGSLTYDDKLNALLYGDNDRIRMVSMDGVVTTLAGGAPMPVPAQKDWSAVYLWPQEHVRMITQVVGDDQTELLYSGSQLYAVRHGKRSAQYFSVWGAFETYSGFKRTGPYVGPHISAAGFSRSLQCGPSGEFRPGSRSILSDKTMAYYGSLTLEEAYTKRCTFDRVVDKSDTIIYQEYSRNDIPHPSRTTIVDP